MKNSILLFLKGMAMGAANVIPGVSGGTIAFITGIYDELIATLKSFDLTAVKLFFGFKFKELFLHINLKFLIVLFAGVGISLVSLGKGLGFLFDNYPIPVWAFFFGLILASVIQVGKTIQDWNSNTIIATLIGIIVAVGLAYMKPASESENVLYLVICGVVAMSSMLLPGLSGSFVLILMGNYQLIMLEAIPGRNLTVIGAVGIGAVIGFLILSHAISYLLGHFKNQTVGSLTGFIFGSLLIIWPWKSEVYLTNDQGEFLMKKGEKIVMGYDWLAPQLDTVGIIAFGLMIAGFTLALGIEFLGNKFSKA